MDVCLMSMVEVCYELEGLVEYLVSSESFSPAAGWPYGHILEQIDATLQKNKKAGTEELASLIVSEYISFYNDYVVGGLSVDQSVLKVSASVPLVKAVKDFTKAIEGVAEGAVVQGCHHPGSLGIAILQRGAVRRPSGFLRAVGRSVSESGQGVRDCRQGNRRLGPEVVLHWCPESVLEWRVDLFPVVRGRAGLPEAGVCQPCGLERFFAEVRRRDAPRAARVQKG